MHGGPVCADITTDEVIIAAKEMMTGKSHATKCTPALAVKLAMQDENVQEKIMKAMNKRLHSLAHDDETRQYALGALLSKKMAPKDPSGFRLIGISDELEKMYAVVLTNRLNLAHDEATDRKTLENGISGGTRDAGQKKHHGSSKR